MDEVVDDMQEKVKEAAKEQAKNTMVRPLYMLSCSVVFKAWQNLRDCHNDVTLPR